MATKDEWVEQEEFDKTADEVLLEKGGDLKKVNANMIATRMGRKKANPTFYRLFDEWKHRRRVQTHLPPFVVQDKHREMLEAVLVAVGTEISAEATHVAGFRTRDLQDDNDSLRGDRNDLLTMVDERDAALKAASRQIDHLEQKLMEARSINTDQASKIEKLEQRIFEIQSTGTSLNDPAVVKKLAELVATAVASTAAKQVLPEGTVMASPQLTRTAQPEPVAEGSVDLLSTLSVEQRSAPDQAGEGGSTS